MTRAARLAAVALAVLCVAGPVRAAEDEYARYFNAMVRLYESLEYERALEQLERARKHSRGADDDIALALYEGTIRSDLGQAEQARAAFKTALLLRPDVQIPVKVSPKVRREFEELRKDVKRELEPLLKKQREEEEKKRKEEEAKRAEEEKKAQEAKRADEVRKAEEARRREEAARLDALKRTEEQQRLDLARALEQRREDERRRREGGDAPRQPQLIPVEPRDTVSAAPTVPGKRKFPVAGVVFLALGAGAGGVATGFGLESRREVAAARGTSFQDETVAHLATAQTNATVANVAIGTAAAAGLAALVAFIVWGVEPVAPESGGATP